jgi:ribosomal protein S18 acetylase RimI-like enzyme
MDNIKIRGANENDLAVLIEFEQEIIKAEREFDNSLKEGATHYYNFQDLIASPKAKVLIAEIDNEIVGSGFAMIKEAEFFLKHCEYAYIGLMYVKPLYRGKGINQQILQILKEWIIGRKITEIRLVVYDENILAKNAYQKAGFKGHVLEMRMEIKKSKSF